MNNFAAVPERQCADVEGIGMIINKIVLNILAVFLRYRASKEDPIPNGKGKM